MNTPAVAENSTNPVNSESPIGIFDSGVGGLTVARAIIDQLPHESIIYVGDTKNGPYGPKPLAQVRTFALEVMDKLVAAGVPVMQPAGGHAVYLDAKTFLSHIPSSQYPGQALVCALYVEGGIRAVEIGSLMFGKYDEQHQLIPATLELVRLAIPRRVYTQSHIDYVAEVIIEVYTKRDQLKGLSITEEAPLLRHFTAKLKPV